MVAVVASPAVGVNADNLAAVGRGDEADLVGAQERVVLVVGRVTDEAARAHRLGGALGEDLAGHVGGVADDDFERASPGVVAHDLKGGGNLCRLRDHATPCIGRS